ncbi:MAG: ribosome maturation factor RimM [Blastocatellia bacterium]|jgi:16S rRNA processing protein RimM|nr:ribosome maturation factor RimM [Blastocatellia bacterium]
MNSTEHVNDGIVIARIARAWGIRGEVTADILTDFPERFDELGKVTLRRGVACREAVLERFRFHKGRVLLKFEGIETMNDAMPLAGHDVVIPESDVFEIQDEDVFYEFDLVGCSVETVGGGAVGVVTGILHTGAGELLAIAREGRSDALVPFVEAICTEVDIDARRIVIDPPEGLLDL